MNQFFFSYSDPILHSSSGERSDVKTLLQKLILEENQFAVQDILPNTVPDPSSLNLASEYACPVGQVVMIPDCGKYISPFILKQNFFEANTSRKNEINSNCTHVVPCAVGTYFDQTNRTCHPCPQGSYQSETGQLQCLRCPSIAGRIGVTAGSGARSAADCKGISNELNKIYYYDMNSFLYEQNAVLLVNFWTRRVAFVVHVDTVSINQKKALSHVSCVVLVKQHDQLKQHPAMNAAMNVRAVNSWEVMVAVNPVHVDRIDRKAFNPHVHHVLLEEPLQRLVHLQLKNVRCQYANPARISMVL